MRELTIEAVDVTRVYLHDDDDDVTHRSTARCVARQPLRVSAALRAARAESEGGLESDDGTFPAETLNTRCMSEG